MTSKELQRKLTQEKYDVKGYDVVFIDKDGIGHNIGAVDKDADNKKVLLLSESAAAAQKTTAK